MEMNVLVILMVAFALFAILMFILFYVYAKKYYNEKHMVEDYNDDAIDEVDVLGKNTNNVDEKNELKEIKEDDSNVKSIDESVEEEFVPRKKK